MGTVKIIKITKLLNSLAISDGDFWWIINDDLWNINVSIMQCSMPDNFDAHDQNFTYLISYVKVHFIELAYH